MREKQIERQVERIIDDIDAKYLSGEYTDEQYNALIRSVDSWANEQYAIAKSKGEQ